MRAFVFSVGVFIFMPLSLFPHTRAHTHTPPPIKEVVIMRWMSSDTIKLIREELAQGRSLTSIRWASCWLCNITRMCNISRKAGQRRPSEIPFRDCQNDGFFPLETRLRNTWLHYPFLLFITLSFRYVKIWLCGASGKYITGNEHWKGSG